MTHTIESLRARKWSDRSIARYLDLPLEHVRHEVSIIDNLAEARAAERPVFATSVRRQSCRQNPVHAQKPAPAPPAHNSKIDVERAAELRESGVRLGEIGAIFGVSKSAVSVALRKRKDRLTNRQRQTR